MASWSHSQNILQHLSQAFPTKAMWSFTASYYFILLSSSLMSVMISVAFLALCPLPSFLLQNVSLMSHYLWKFENSVFPPPWHVWCFCHWKKKKKKKAFMEGLSSFLFVALSSPVSVPSFVPSIPLYIVLSYLKSFSFEILANHANSNLESFLFHHMHNHILTTILC